MNKLELIDATASNSDLAKIDAKKVIEAFVDVVSENLKNNERIALVGFGSFSILDRKTRIGRNPQTGKEITIKAKKVVKFKPGSDLLAQIQ